MKVFKVVGFFFFILVAQTSMSHAAPVASEMSFEGVKEFVLGNFVANVHIKTVDATDGKVEMKISVDEGLNEYLENLNVSNSGGVLTLEDKRLPDDVNFAMLSDLLTANGKTLKKSTAKDLPRIEITLPKKTALNLKLFAGLLEVDDLEAPLSVLLKGAGSVKMGKVLGNTKVHISGAGSILGKQLSGEKLVVYISGTGHFRANTVEFETASLYIKGTGDVNLRDGLIKDSVNAIVKGTGSCILNVTADKALLEVLGVGRIYLHKATDRVNRSVMGLGKITVGNKEDSS